jgi:hypothetical protein
MLDGNTKMHVVTKFFYTETCQGTESLARFVRRFAIKTNFIINQIPWLKLLTSNFLKVIKIYG